MDNLSVVQFVIDGSAAEQVHAWQERSDWEYMRSRLEAGGRIIVTAYQGVRMLRELDFLPEPGEAVPYYGAVSGTSRYQFTPRAFPTYQLTLTNTGFPPSPCEPAKSFDVDLANPACWLVPPGHAFHTLNSENILFEEEAELTFTLLPGILQKLSTWPHWGELPEAYAWEFQPTSVGCLGWAEHLASGKRFALAGLDNL